MNLTQNEKLRQVTEGTVVIGVDIASEVQYARAFDWREIELGRVFRFRNTLEGFRDFQEWINQVGKANNKEAVVVGIEPTGHYWLTLFQYLKETNIRLVIVNPFHVKQSKEMDDNHPTKTDAKDPKTIARLVLEGRYMYPYVPEGIYAEIRSAVECRRRTAKEIGVLKNQIARWVKIYFPEYDGVYRYVCSKSSIALLSRAPFPEKIQELGVNGIRSIWAEAKIRMSGKKAEAIVKAAYTSIGCRPVASAQMTLDILLSDYKTKLQQYERVRACLETLCVQVKGADKLLAAKGIGLIAVSEFLAEVGDVNRFASPKQIQKLAGLALCETSSGRHKGQTTISRRGRPWLRTAMYRAVLTLLRCDPGFASLHHHYTCRAKNPLEKKQSIVALCCKLIRIFYAILTKNTEYDTERMMRDIQRPQLAV